MYGKRWHVRRESGGWEYVEVNHANDFQRIFYCAGMDMDSTPEELKDKLKSILNDIREEYVSDIRELYKSLKPANDLVPGFHEVYQEE
jgi:hypothetical protein